MSWEFDGMIDNGLFCRRLDSVLNIGLPSISIKWGIDSIYFDCGPVPIKGISGNAHNLAGPGNVPEYFAQIEQTEFMLNNFLASMKHEGYLPVLMCGRTFIKTGNPHLGK